MARPVLFCSAVSLCLGVAAAPAPARQDVRPTAGAVIDKTTRIAPGRYRLASASIERPALVIRGANITVDLRGVEIDGGDPLADPDTFTGTGVVVDGPGVTIIGGIIRGFKVGILARKSPKLHIAGADLSYNWKPRLRSGIEEEDQADWLSFHNNEKDEWLRYGAAIYLSECDGAQIDNTRAVQGMNGLMVTRSAHLDIWNNTFSWLSGVGIGFYRTTDSTIDSNRLDWDVRGYSHGFYNRGQDSAALLMYEQSSRNLVVRNSATHGGDGLFLWAGQSTMDTGEGGANDNRFFNNDFSHAVANGIEATFSKNDFRDNRIDDCWHGVWGGYSYESTFANNTFSGNTEGIAIEHGQNNLIVGNHFSGGDVAVRLWANATQDPNWGYPKHRDTSSRGYLLSGNTFENSTVGVSLIRTSKVQMTGNTYAGVATEVRLGEGAAPLDAFKPQEIAFPLAASDLGGRTTMNAKLPEGARRGRATIIVDDWGPYDYRSPKIWPAGSPGERPLHLRVLGPPGQWTLSSITGASASASGGAVPGEIVVTPSSAVADLAIDLEYRGAEVVTPRGQVIAAGLPSHVTYALFDPSIAWNVKFWKFDAATDPLTAGAAFNTLLASSAPVRTENLTRLGFANAQAFGAGFAAHIGVTADGTITLPAGTYQLSITSDDGIRVWVDDQLVLEDWTIHGPKEDRVPLSAGAHRLRVQYFQNTGAAALVVKVVRVTRALIRAGGF